MDNKEVVDAVHKLEVSLTEKMGKQTTALEVNNERLLTLKEAVDKHRVILFGHEENAHPGLITRVASIEKADKERKYTVRTVTGAFFALCGKFIWDLWQT